MSFEEEARRIVESFAQQPVVSLKRFETGLAHYVFDVVCKDGRNIVARLAQPGSEATLAGAVYWSQRLRPLGVPLPELLAFDLTRQKFDYAYLLLERLPGQDLGPVYSTLTPDQKRTLAREVAGIQKIVNTLPPGPGYGFALSYEAALKKTWAEVVLGELERNRFRIEQAGVFKLEVVSRAQKALALFEPYFAQIAPKPFLDDTTTKNVMINEGKLSGIVDVDMVCFGDPLFVVALTNMALLSRDYATDYIEFWCDELDLSKTQRQVLNAYTALFCVNFMGEIGQRFNRDEPIPADPAQVELFQGILDKLLSGLN